MKYLDQASWAGLEVSVFTSELGWMGFTVSDSTVRQLTFAHPSAEQTLAALHLPAFYTEQLSRATLRLAERLRNFADGGQDDFSDVSVDLNHLTPFALSVVKRCRATEWGSTLSYGELAQLVGVPGAARAVGSVMAKNRFPLIVPCHRVIGSGGGLGGYSAPQGLRMKRWLLDREQRAVVRSSPEPSAVPSLS